MPGIRTQENELAGSVASPHPRATRSCLMKNRKNPDLPPRLKARHLPLHPATIEKTFTDSVMDLQEVIVLDGIDILPNNSGFRVRCHDLREPLPEIVIQDRGDTFRDKDRIGRDACKESRSRPQEDH